MNRGELGLEVLELIILITTLSNLSCAIDSQEILSKDKFMQKQNFTNYSYCVLNGRTYSVGKFRIGRCVTCTCDGATGSVRCGVESCANSKNCIRYELEADECCPRCVERGCEYEGNLYKKGSTFHKEPCTVCTCETNNSHHSMVMKCAKEKCDPPPCSDPLLLPTFCCPICRTGEPHEFNDRHQDPYKRSNTFVIFFPFKN